MNNLHKSILVLFTHLSIVFLLGWADLGRENILDLGIPFFLLIILAMLATITLPFLRKSSVYVSLVIWVPVYLVVRLLDPFQAVLIGGIETYHTIVEIAILSLSVFLAYEVSRNLMDVERAIAQITIPDLGMRILSMREAGNEISSEFVRARRHNRPMSMVVVEPEEGAVKVGLTKVAQQIQEKMMERYLLASIAKVIGEEARRIDLILEQDDNGRFAILCPETDHEGSLRMAKRIRDSVKEQLGVDMHFGSASFPEQALTFEDILQKAEANLRASISEEAVDSEPLRPV